MKSLPPSTTHSARALAWALVLSVAATASAELPDAETVLRDLGFGADQIAQVKSGQMVEGSAQASDAREIDARLAFLAQTPPARLVEQLRQDLLDRVDPNTLAAHPIEGAPDLASFSGLKLEPEGEKRAKAYAGAAAGEDLNLSAGEIAAFRALGAGASTADVEGVLRRALWDRLRAYQSGGLAGIADYARSGGKTASAADDLRSATRAAKQLMALAPDAHQALLDYPKSRPKGMQETYEWSQFRAHGVPTIALTHTFFIPEGEAWVVAQRQFYVSGGYNCEQAILALVPMQQGTLVAYTNRTSTDQVTGFGGSTRRSIGSKLLASQLEGLYGKVQAAEKTGGS